MKASIVSASLFAAAVSAHGNITSPPARQAGAAMAALCGQAAVDTVNADPTIPLEDVTATSAQCKFSRHQTIHRDYPTYICRADPTD
jgi:predicted carbohydrate-binding protein with CBM5 and CBM33 domain